MNGFIIDDNILFQSGQERPQTRPQTPILDTVTIP